MPSPRGMPLPPSAQVVAPCYAEAHAESEETVPPDNRVAERRAVLQRVGDDDAGCERECGYESGGDSVARSLEHAEKRDVGGEHDVNQRDCAHAGSAPVRRLAAKPEERDDSRSERPHQSRDAHRHQKRHRDCLPRAEPHPLDFARPHVLPGVSGERRLEGVARKVHVHLHPLPHRERRRHRPPEAVHRPLYERQSERHDDELERNREAQNHGALGNRKAEREIPGAEAEDRIFSPHINPRRHERDRLRDVGRDCRARYPHAESRHKKQVERDVQDGRDEQEVERCRAVAHRPQD